MEEHGLKTVHDEGALREVVEKVLAQNPQSVADYKGGKQKAIGFLVGQTMKAMKGKADPGLVNRMLGRNGKIEREIGIYSSAWVSADFIYQKMMKYFSLTVWTKIDKINRTYV